MIFIDPSLHAFVHKHIAVMIDYAIDLDFDNPSDCRIDTVRPWSAHSIPCK